MNKTEIVDKVNKTMKLSVLLLTNCNFQSPELESVGYF